MRNILAFCLVIFLLLFIPSVVFAQVSVNPCEGDTLASRFCVGQQNVGRVLGSLISAAFVVATIIALAWLIYGGVKWILSGGDKTNVETARNHIIASIIGLIIVFLSYFIITFTLAVFGLTLKNLVIQPIPFDSSSGAESKTEEGVVNAGDSCPNNDRKKCPSGLRPYFSRYTNPVTCVCNIPCKTLDRTACQARSYNDCEWKAYPGTCTDR